MVEVHPAAIVHKETELEEGVKVGPFAFIDKHVKIGKDTEVGHGAIITGQTTIGSNCKIHMGAVIGHEAQVKGLADIESYVKIGKNNIIREYVTIHRSMKEEGLTSIGDDNFIMANVHIAHDCQIGNGVVITNFSQLAGHVEVENFAFISGLVGTHQFVRIGELAMVGGQCGLRQDVPPYMLAQGYLGRICGLNIVGLRRAGISLEIRNEIKRAYRILFSSDLNITQAIEKIKEELPHTPQLERLVEFVGSSSRGICKPRRAPKGKESKD